MARLKDFVLAHQSLLNQWWESRGVHRQGGSFLFVGPSGVGKRKSAVALAQALVCENKNSPCGLCGPCLRAERGSSESLLIVEPDGQQIKMEQAQQVLHFLQLKVMGPARVVIIDPATSFNAHSGNALLKIIEEPPPNTYFFLICHSLTGVLPTLRSRCQILRFSPLSVSDLQKIFPAPPWVYKACQGRAELLLQFQDQEEIALREDALALLREIISNEHFLTTGQWREMVKDKSFWPKFLLHAQRAVHDGVLLQQSGDLLAFFQDESKKDMLYNPDQKELLMALAQLSQTSLENLSLKLSEYEQDLLLHRDPVLQSESLWVNL